MSRKCSVGPSKLYAPAVPGSELCQTAHFIYGVQWLLYRRLSFNDDALAVIETDVITIHEPSAQNELIADGGNGE